MIARDDTMMMNRDDVLRELELLPMWQLRTPVGNASTLPIENVAEKPAVQKPVETAQQCLPKMQLNFDYFQSEDSTWIFICAQDGMPAIRIDIASQSMLLNNIFAALQIKAKKYDGDFADSQLPTQAKVLIAMGEKTAQTLLDSTEPIDNLRSKQHLLHKLPLIVTYSAAEILEHLPNKAKTWDDLCTALNIVNA